MSLLEMVAHRGQQRHRRRLDQLGRGGALDGQRIRARHDGDGVARDGSRCRVSLQRKAPLSAGLLSHTHFLHVSHTTSCTAPEIRNRAGSRRGSRTYCRVSSGRERRTIHSAAQIVRHMLEE